MTEASRKTKVSAHRDSPCRRGTVTRTVELDFLTEPRARLQVGNHAATTVCTRRLRVPKPCLYLASTPTGPTGTCTSREGWRYLRKEPADHEDRRTCRGFASALSGKTGRTDDIADAMGLLGRLLDKMFGASIPTEKEKTIDDYRDM